MNLNMTLLLLAGIIIATLSGVAIHLHWKLHQQRRLRAAQDTKMAEVAREQRDRINGSIQIIAQATLADDVSLTEASIRISMLLDSLDVADTTREEFSAFYQLREVTAHIPILDAWKQLSRVEQARFDLQRMQHEATYGDFVRDAAKRIRGKAF